MPTVYIVPTGLFGGVAKIDGAGAIDGGSWISNY